MSKILIPQIIVYGTDEFPLRFIHPRARINESEQHMQDFFKRFLGKTPVYLGIRRDLCEILDKAEFSGENTHSFEGTLLIPFLTKIYYYSPQNVSLTIVKGLPNSDYNQKAYLHVKGYHQRPIEQVERKIGLREKTSHHKK